MCVTYLHPLTENSETANMHNEIFILAVNIPVPNVSL